MLTDMAVPSLPLPILRAEFVHGLSDHSRQSILELLRSGEMRVADLVEATGLSQPNVSKHLRCLRECGLVLSEKRGREAFYSLPDIVQQLLDVLDATVDELAPQMAACQLTGETVECCP